MYAKFSKNAPNYVYSMYQKIKKCTKFYAFIVHFFFSNNVYKFINIDNFKKVYIIFFNCTHFFKDFTKFFQRIYKIMYIQLAQFVKKYKK